MPPPVAPASDRGHPRAALLWKRPVPPCRSEAILQPWCWQPGPGARQSCWCTAGRRCCPSCDPALARGACPVAGAITRDQGLTCRACMDPSAFSETWLRPAAAGSLSSAQGVRKKRQQPSMNTYRCRHSASMHRLPGSCKRRSAQCRPPVRPASGSASALQDGCAALAFVNANLPLRPASSGMQPRP